MLKNFDINHRRKEILDLKRVKPATAILQPTSKIASRQPDSYAVSSKRPQGRRRSVSLLTLLIILLFLLVGAAVAGFFVFYDKGPSGKSIKVTLAAPKEAVAGEDFTIALEYENLDKVPLDGFEIVMEYPENFYFQSANLEPINAEKNVWRPDKLLPGAKQRIELAGYLIKDDAGQRPFVFIVHYQPENFSSNFTETLDKDIKISKSLLNVTVEAPDMVADESAVIFKIKYQNDSDRDLTGLNLVLDAGEAFKASSLTPAASSTAWQIPKLESKQSGEITMVGKIDSTIANPLNWEFSVWQKKEANNRRYYYKKTGKIIVEAPQISVRLLAADNKTSANWGENNTYKITIENSGKIAINQAVLKLSFFGQQINWPAFDGQSNAKVDEPSNSLVWLSTNGGWTEKLAEIKPGDKLETTVAVPIINEPDDLTNLDPAALVLDAQATLSFKANDKHKVFSSEHLQQNLNSQLRLITEARYNLDQQTKVGSGPVPPVIGKTTMYRIYWKIFSGSQALSNVKISTTLPAYVNWLAENTSVTMGDPVKFDTASREVSWTIPSLSANSQIMAEFNLSVTPVESQVNQLLILTNTTNLEALAMPGNTPLSKTTNLLTSDLLGDPVTQGQGRVRVSE